MVLNDRSVYSVVGLRDLFSNPDKVWIVVASQSPERPRILKNHLGVTNVLTMPSGFEENLDKNNYETVGDYCADTAEHKGRMVAETIFKANDSNSKERVKNLLSNPFGKVDENFDLDKVQFVISADTAVGLNGEVYEKPKDREEAKRHISSSSGVYQNVSSGVAIFVRKNGYETPAKKFYTLTKIKFQKLSNEDVEAFLDTLQYQGSAGSYKITMFAESLIEEMVGSYTNVIGLPAQSVSRALCELVKQYNFV